MPMTKYTHHRTEQTSLGTEISTGMDAEHRRGRSELIVRNLSDGKTEVTITQSHWELPKGRTVTKIATIMLNEKQRLDLIEAIKPSRHATEVDTP